MLVILICTEGDVSEPAYLNALKSTLSGQAPLSHLTAVEIMSLPLGGNQGHSKLIEAASLKIKEAKNDDNSILSICGEDEDYENWLVCDYDDMDKKGVKIGTLRKQAEEAGFRLIVSKPNFEVFVLMHFMQPSEIARIRPKNYSDVIDSHISKLNISNAKNRGFSDVMKVPTYSKKKHHANKFFGVLLDRNPELLEMPVKCELDLNSKCFSEMPILVRRFIEIYIPK